MADIVTREYVGKPKKLKKEFAKDSAKMMKKGYEITNQTHLAKSGGRSKKRWFMLGFLNLFLGGKRDTMMVTYTKKAPISRGETASV